MSQAPRALRPFIHFGVEKAEFYRAVLAVFAAASRASPCTCARRTSR